MNINKYNISKGKKGVMEQQNFKNQNKKNI